MIRCLLSWHTGSIVRFPQSWYTVSMIHLSESWCTGSMIHFSQQWYTSTSFHNLDQAWQIKSQSMVDTRSVLVEPKSFHGRYQVSLGRSKVCPWQILGRSWQILSQAMHSASQAQHKFVRFGTQKATLLPPFHNLMPNLREPLRNHQPYKKTYLFTEN